ncbi:MAG: FAD-dependent oxidoreductase [Syntrophomonas sp.]
MRIIIIGNGAAGNQAAQTIQNYDPEVEITILGAESIPFYSACALPDYLAGWIKREQLFLRNSLDRHQVKIRLGQTVEDIKPDRQAVTAGGELLFYDRLIIASGSRPVLPNIPGTGLPGNFVIKSVQDIDRILAHNPRRIVVIGSGNIGIEAAETLEYRGCRVSIIEMMPRIMPRLFDEQPALLIRKILENHGIEIHTGEKAREVIGNDRVAGLVTDHREIACDTVIWAAGVRQNTELARAAGIEIGGLGGIKVDSQMKTSHPEIYACGDCVETSDLLTGKPALCLLWSCAKAQAEVAARNCLGEKIVYPGALKLVAEEAYGKPCVAAGLLEEELDTEGLKIIEQETENTYHRILIKDERIMGVQAVGSMEAVGPLLYLMKKMIKPSEIKRIVNSPALLKNMPWMLTVDKYWQ